MKRRKIKIGERFYEMFPTRKGNQKGNIYFGDLKKRAVKMKFAGKREGTYILKNIDKSPVTGDVHECLKFVFPTWEHKTVFPDKNREIMVLVYLKNFTSMVRYKKEYSPYWGEEGEYFLRRCKSQKKKKIK